MSDDRPPLHLHELGSPGGPPLLALHGLAGHGRRWRALDGRHPYRLLAPDLRGHGRSTSLPPWTLEQHAADMLAVIDGLGLAAVPVVAHSFGAAVALHLLRLAPGRVSKLVLLDPSIGLRPELALDGASQPEPLFGSRKQAWAEQRASWPAVVPDAAVDAEVHDNVGQVGKTWRFRYCPPAVVTAWSEMSRAAVLPSPGTPTLLVRALGQPYVSPAFVNGCRLALGSEFTLVNLDCGHMIYLERPAETAELITRFVGQG
ncbi:MAG TPA: alpha/beta hydrolase [Pseudonocardiaceae bacterium]|jgi:lipase|nr:alpha/beta hydrolase [Pseudonocardiaceae bacterium]